MEYFIRSVTRPIIVFTVKQKAAVWRVSLCTTTTGGKIFYYIFFFCSLYLSFFASLLHLFLPLPCAVFPCTMLFHQNELKTRALFHASSFLLFLCSLSAFSCYERLFTLQAEGVSGRITLRLLESEWYIHTYNEIWRQLEVRENAHREEKNEKKNPSFKYTRNTSFNLNMCVCLCASGRERNYKENK